MNNRNLVFFREPHRLSFQLAFWVLLLLLVFSQDVLAYGFKGHRIIANGAYAHLTPQTQARVQQILADESIADGSVWPDVMRNTGRCEVRAVQSAFKHRESLSSELSSAKAQVWLAELASNSQCKDKLDKKLKQLIHDILLASDVAKANQMQQHYVTSFKDYQFWQASKPWHYVNVPPGKTYQQITKNPAGDIITAIETFSAILSGKGKKHPEIIKPLEAYLGHLPLKEKEQKMKSFALKFLVHFIGDLHQPLHAGHKADLGGNAIRVSWFDKLVNLHRVWDTSLLEGQGLSQQQFEDLMVVIPKAQKDKYMQSNLHDWLDEALELRLTAYDISGYNGKLNQSYVDKHQAIFNQQLQKASVRLAMTLNKILK